MLDGIVCIYGNKVDDMLMVDGHIYLDTGVNTVLEKLYSFSEIVCLYVDGYLFICGWLSVCIFHRRMHSEEYAWSEKCRREKLFLRTL